MVEPLPLVTIQPRRAASWPLWIATAWSLIFSYRLAQLLRSYLYLCGVKRRASISNEPLPATGRTPRLLLSTDLDSPIAAGFARPAVILPASLPAKLSREEMDYVLLHEAAHLARWDDWTNLLAHVVGAVTALHPVAHWILHRIERDREAACDDWVVARTQSPRPYARSLARMYELRLAQRQRFSEELLASGMFGGGSHLSERIEALLRRGRDFAPRMSAKRAGASATALLGLAAIASLSPRWIALAQPSAGPEFEVASVRPSNPDQGFINAVTPSLKVGGDRNLTFVQVTLRDLIMLAYGVGTPQIQGPKFLNGTPEAPADRFDIVARVPAGATKDQIPLMLRALLAERFHLGFHRENKTMQIYALEAGKGAPKMKESPEGAAALARCTRSFAEHEGATLAAVCASMTTADIAQQVQALAPGYFRNTPVVDRSGLQGVYDFKLEWITAAQARDGGSGPTMIDAVEEQLGLKLERRREAVEVMVIDTLDRTPTEN
jgi:uncharacterized protein (TIGR03435 family)